MLKKSPFIALKDRDFALFTIGLFISRIGNAMQDVAIHWQIYLMTGSAVSLGLIGLSRVVPLILVSLFAGVVADRHDRKKIILFAQTLGTFISLFLTVGTYIGFLSPFYIYVALAIQSVGIAFDMAARQALLPNLISKNYFSSAVS